MSKRTLKPIVKILLAAWIIYLIVVIPSVFIESYCQAIGHWSEDAWEGMIFVLSCNKVTLTTIIIIYAADKGAYNG